MTDKLNVGNMHIPRKDTVVVDGKEYPRPISKPNEDMYTRLPDHMKLEDGTPDYLKMIISSKVYNILPLQGTPLTEAKILSKRFGVKVYLKREDLTPVFSYKLRGAYNMMSMLTQEERWKGVIASSAGNHAQGVAMSAKALGIAATIVMPQDTPRIKWSNVDRLGAKVILTGRDFDEAKKECARLTEEHGLTNIPPFDDPYVIAGGGGTVGMEVLRQVSDINNLEAIFVPVGGGGLMSGILAYVKQIAPPHVKVVAVETYDSDGFAKSLMSSHVVSLNEVGLFAEGTAVRTMGRETFRISSDLVDELVYVTNDEVCGAIKDIFDDTRSIAEPSGAIALAGMKKYIEDHNLQDSGKSFVPIVSGANINFSRLRFIAERSDMGEGNEAMLRVIIPEKPGTFFKLHDAIYPRAITEFSYRYSSDERAFIFVSFLVSTSTNPTARTLKSKSYSELEEILLTLRGHGFDALDISRDDFAKDHLRYLMGGRYDVPNERIFRFEFPERHGALRRFLESLNGEFNISLFHYRNQGGDIGKVLCAFQVPSDKNSDFEDYLSRLGYPYYEETSNPMYKEFLHHLF